MECGVNKKGGTGRPYRQRDTTNPRIGVRGKYIPMAVSKSRAPYGNINYSCLSADALIYIK
jgi:hypothetical protein